jgi:hypothetical protein
MELEGQLGEGTGKDDLQWGNQRDVFVLLKLLGSLEKTMISHGLSERIRDVPTFEHDWCQATKNDSCSVS